MENILMLMWAADVVGKATVVCVMLVVAYCVATFVGFVARSVDKNEAVLEFLRKGWTITVVVCALALSIVIPSRSTMHAIVAAKAGEVVATSVAESSLGQKAGRAIDAALTRIVEGDKK